MSTIESSNILMHELIEAFPNNIKDAIKIGRNSLLKNNMDFNNVLICGMGGSGIGGKIVSSWIQNEISIPVLFCQDYSIPEFVNNKTLVIACSYSGNTEETLISSESARLKGATVIGICTGGELSNFCQRWGFDSIIIPGGNPPRSGLAYSVVQLVNVFIKLDLISAANFESLSSAANLLQDEQTYIKGEAEKLARFIQDKQLMIYSESKYEGVAIRARQQFNENSKLLVNHHIIPEMNHNELLGWTGGDESYGVLLINSEDFHEKNTSRLNFTTTFIKEKSPHIFSINAKGNSLIERTLFLINIIDWSSLFYATNNNIDSVEIKVIEKLKKHLASN